MNVEKMMLTSIDGKIVFFLIFIFQLQLTFNNSSRCTAQWSDIYIIYKVIHLAACIVITTLFTIEINLMGCGVDILKAFSNVVNLPIYSSYYRVPSLKTWRHAGGFLPYKQWKKFTELGGKKVS